MTIMMFHKITFIETNRNVFFILIENLLSNPSTHRKSIPQSPSAIGGVESQKYNLH